MLINLSNAKQPVNQAAAQLVMSYVLGPVERDSALYLLGRMMLNCPDPWESFPYGFRFRVLRSCVIAYRLTNARLQ